MGQSHKSYIVIFLILAVLPILALSAYSNTFHSPLVLDDYHSFVDEPNVYIPVYNREALIKLSQTKFGVRRYLPMLTFSFDHWRGRGRLSTYHVTNLAIHFASFLALIFMLKMLFRVPDAIGDDIAVYDDLIVLFVAGMWLLSPLQTNAVTYVVQRMTSLMTFFYFFSFACYLTARLEFLKDKPSVIKSVIFFLFSFGAAICAFISKENSAMLPVVIVAIELIFFEPSWFKYCLKNRKILMVLVVSGLVVGLLGAFLVIPHILEGYAIRRFSLSERLLTELRVVVAYMFILLLPLPSLLNLEHDVVVSTSLFSPVTTLLSLFFLFSLIVVVWRLPGKYNLIRFGFFWFIINLVIESSIVPLELMFEHRLYLPSVGFYLIVVLIFFIFIQRLLRGIDPGAQGKIFISLGLIVCAFFTFLTYQRNVAWGSAVSLYQDCVAKAPLKARCYAGLSKAFSLEKNYKGAMSAAEKSIELSRNHYEEYWSAACNLVAAEMQENGYQSACLRGEELLENAPESTKQNALPFFLANLGLAYFRNGQYTKALAKMEQSLRYFAILKDNASIEKTAKRIILAYKRFLEFEFMTFENLTETKERELSCAMIVGLFLSLHDYKRAELYCNSGLNAFPDDKELLKKRQEISAIEVANELQKSKGTLKEKYFLHPFRSSSHFMMATAYAIQKFGIPADFVLKYCLGRLAQQGSFPVDYKLLDSWYLYKKGRLDEALKLIKDALKIDPKYAQLWVNCGIYQLAEEDGDSALKSFNKALELYPDYPQKAKVQSMILMAEKKNRESDSALR